MMLAKIVPAEQQTRDSPSPTRGTRVVLPSGEHLPGVTRIELVADVDDVWRATITCMVEPSPIHANCVVQTSGPSLWRRVLNSILPSHTVDITKLESTATGWHKAW